MCSPTTHENEGATALPLLVTLLPATCREWSSVLATKLELLAEESERVALTYQDFVAVFGSAAHLSFSTIGLEPETPGLQPEA